MRMIPVTTFTVMALLFCSATMAHEAGLADTAPIIDGRPDDAAWNEARWRPMEHVYIGEQPDAADLTGRYKVVWTPDYLFVLAEIVDDVLIDSHPNPVVDYWHDDTLEILLDEDASGGLHHFDYNAFAYHIALDNQVVDIAPFETGTNPTAAAANVRTFPDHVRAYWRRDIEEPTRIYWEVRVTVFGDDYAVNDEPVRLAPGKTLGFMVAYVDADSAAGREHFIGDVDIEPVDGDRNRAYIDASVFGQLTLSDDTSK